MLRKKAMSSIHHLVMKHRRGVYGVWILLCILSVVSLIVHGVQIDTSRQNLVGDQDVDAQRFLHYSRLFGATLNVAVVVDGHRRDPLPDQ